MPDMKKFFMTNNNIAADVAAFLSKEIAKIKNPTVWKAELFDQLARMETTGTVCSAVYDVKQAELMKFDTICGYSIADLVLNNAPNDFVLDTALLTSDALIEALDNAREIVLKTSDYDDSNFMTGFLSNAKEFIWTMICKAEAMKTAISEVPSSTETQHQDDGIQENTNIKPAEEEPKKENKGCGKCKECTNCEKSDYKNSADAADESLVIPIGTICVIVE